MKINIKTQVVFVCYVYNIVKSEKNGRIGATAIIVLQGGSIPPHTTFLYIVSNAIFHLNLSIRQL